MLTMIMLSFKLLSQFSDISEFLIHEITLYFVEYQCEILFCNHNFNLIKWNTDCYRNLLLWGKSNDNLN